MFINPITHKKHRKWSRLHKAINQKIKRAVTGPYDEIIQFGEQKRDKFGFPLPKQNYIRADEIIRLFKPALENDYVDLDSKGRGSALNYDLYAYDASQGVAVIQARQYYKRAASHFGATRKTYFLCGRNEVTGEFFRHPVSAHTVRATCKKSTHPTRADVVESVQRWMWQVTPRQLQAATRQGDVLFVPQKPPKSAKRAGLSLTLANSHKILADEIRLNGKCFALNPRAIHNKDQHAPVELMTGWYSIRVARTAKAWDFAGRIGD